MLKLLIDEKQFADSGLLPVSWCLDPKTLLEINEKATKDKQPFIVIVAAPEKGYSLSKENRWVAPLSSMMTYISFRFSGKTNIFAFLAWGKSESAVKEAYLYCIARGVFGTTLLSNDGTKMHESFLKGDQENADVTWTPMEVVEAELVDVPANYFAKEPPAWEKVWVNWLYKHKPVDQCEFRGRRFWAYCPIFKPLAFLLIMLYRLCSAMSGLLLALKPLSFKPLYHPFTFPSGDVLPKEGFVKWAVSPELENKTRQALLRILLVPFCPAIVILAGLIGAKVTLGSSWLESAFLGFAWMYMGWIALVVLVCLISDAFVPGVGALIAYRLKRGRVFWHDDDAEDLACYTDMQPLETYKDLPKYKRTRYLWFLDTKGGVCKPFQG